VFDGRCFVRLDSRVLNMFDAGMRTTLAQRPVSIVSSVFDPFSHSPQHWHGLVTIHFPFVPAVTPNLTPLKQNFSSDSSSAPRLEFYLLLFSLINHMHWDLHTYIYYIMNSHNVFFLFEFSNDGMEPSKRHSLISLLFILNCSSKAIVIWIINVIIIYSKYFPVSDWLKPHP